MDVSRSVAGHEKKNRLKLVCDLLPEEKYGTVEQRLAQEKKPAGGRGSLSVVNKMYPQFPKRLLEKLLDESGIPGEQRYAELSTKQLQSLAKHLKELTFSLCGTLGYEKAEVTAGGVKLSEVNSSTMESKLVPNLFFAGEILDLDGPIGGYNFQSAWSTAWLAGQAC